MNHIPVHKLSEYIDGMLDAQEKDSITQHISECPECHQNLMQLKKMILLLSSLKSLSMPSTFNANTLARVKKDYYHKRYYRSIRGSVIAAAIVLIAIITMLPDSIKHDQFNKQIAQNNEESLKLDCIIPTNMDFNTAMMVVQQHKSRILDYSNSYIIVESDVNNFSSIRQVINNYESYRHNIISNVGINHIQQDTNNPKLTHANKKKYIFRLQLR